MFSCLEFNHRLLFIIHASDFSKDALLQEWEIVLLYIEDQVILRKSYSQKINFVKCFVQTELVRLICILTVTPRQAIIQSKYTYTVLIVVVFCRSCNLCYM